ncbi:MAG: hypothetical protein AAFY47_05285 [Pseudomonadota bacterium]
MIRDMDETAAAMTISAGPIGAAIVTGHDKRWWPRIGGKVVAPPDMPAGGYETADDARLAAGALQRNAQLYLEALR